MSSCCLAGAQRAGPVRRICEHVFVTYPLAMVEECVRLSLQGLTIAQVADTLGVSTSSVVRWRSGRLSRDAVLEANQVERCSICGEASVAHRDLPEGRYAYALGLYLGDGCLSVSLRSCQFRVFMDAAYPGIVEEARRALAGLSPTGRAGVYRGSGQNHVVISAYGRRWRCLFPQHGAGKKHERRIVLEDWQQAIVDAYPQPFLRALIHTDGWRGENRVHVKGRDYSYPRYQFSSRSDDIRRLFADACDRLEIEWRPWGRWHISVARREAVAKLDTFIGPKG